MKIKVLILGSAGMLGHVVYHYLLESNKYNIINTSFPGKVDENSTLLDVTNKQEVNNYVRFERPDVVVNCVGVLIKGSREDPSNAIYINSYLPHQLSNLLKESGGKLIHVSTDCVFSGNKGNYSEIDFCDADDTYGRSKALGEVINENDLTIRTSIIGPELKRNGEGLFHWFMNNIGKINGFSNVCWGGVTTLELAKVIDYCIETDHTGLQHVTNGVKISKLELLQLFRNIWNRSDITIVPLQGEKKDKSLITARTDFDYQIPSYDQMLQSLKFWMDSQSNLYRTIY